MKQYPNKSAKGKTSWVYWVSRGFFSGLNADGCPSVVKANLEANDEDRLSDKEVLGQVSTHAFPKQLKQILNDTLPRCRKWIPLSSNRILSDKLPLEHSSLRLWIRHQMRFHEFYIFLLPIQTCRKNSAKRSQEVFATMMELIFHTMNWFHSRCWMLFAERLYACTLSFRLNNRFLPSKSCVLIGIHLFPLSIERECWFLSACLPWTQ